MVSLISLIPIPIQPVNRTVTNELSIMQWLSCALITPACRCCFQSGDQAGNYDCWSSVDSTLKPPKFWEWVRADSKSTCGIALRDKSRVVAPDIANCDFMAGSDDQQTYLQTGTYACQTTPLIGRGGNVVGMISTHWRTPHQPSEKDFQLFDTLARLAADVIESSKGELSF